MAKASSLPSAEARAKELRFLKLWRGQERQKRAFIEFDLDENGTISQKAEQIIIGISKGRIPPDLGNQLIVSMSSLMNIKEKTEFEDRLKAIEDASKQAE